MEAGVLTVCPFCGLDFVAEEGGKGCPECGCCRFVIEAVHDKIMKELCPQE